MMLSLSTCWNSHRHTRGESMLREIVDLGFRNVELGHGIRLSLMEGIQKFFDRGNVNITSLHNFCPLPVEVLTDSPNCYEFTSHQKHERERAVKLTMQTIDFAERLNAPFVVMHLGRVPMPDYTKQLIALAKDGQFLSRKFVSKKLEAVRKREALASLYLRRAQDCLARVADYAAAKNIHLGIESREAIEEVPTEREMPGLLDEINSPYVGYWHDIGHIQIKENLAFLDHADWLTRIRNRLFGCHIHDVIWPARDHRAPFLGDIDYRKLIPLIPKNALFVWEISPNRSKEEILKALDRWTAEFGAPATALVS